MTVDEIGGNVNSSLSKDLNSAKNPQCLHVFFLMGEFFMESFRDLVDKIESPLLFVSRDHFRRLTLVRDLDTALRALLRKGREGLSASTLPPADLRESMDLFKEMEELFLHFTVLSREEQKERITRALGLLSNVRDRLGRKGEFPCPTGATHEESVAVEREERLSLPVQVVRGVGPKAGRLLERMGMKTVEDLLYFLPRRYEDRRHVREIGRLAPGEKATVAGTVTGIGIRKYGRSSILEATLSDGTGVLRVRWLRGNFAYLRNTLLPGKRVILTGEVRFFASIPETIHPDFEVLGEKDDELLHFRRIVPVYPETEGLRQKHLRRIVMEVLRSFGKYLASPIPEGFCPARSVLSFPALMENVHFPGGGENIDSFNAFRSPSHRRVIYDELFFFQLAMALKNLGSRSRRGIPFRTGGPLVERFRRTLPFPLTAEQEKVIGEIETDMARPSPMNRLLQGDVGCGKTVVSMVAMVTACENGFQAAIMAPTEILAEQHHCSIRDWAEELGLKAGLLTGSRKGKERKRLLEEIEGGNIDLVVGTHALIQEGVSFGNLGLVVIDEQHRFGVVQRASLRAKGAFPDVLVMTATPIPRTLALTVYGDLDLSLIRGLPPGRKAVRTRVLREQGRPRLYETIRKEILRGNQVFIVYPLVAESEALDLKDATGMAACLQKEVFPEFRVGLLHGRMKEGEKGEVMASFQRGDIHVLVSTTVVEVGIDIPAASLMVVEHAERFGLSQLHQLRGRVGRSDIPSQCVLMAGEPLSAVSGKRLRVMAETNDGFRIAEEDLEIRGPGEFMGTRQSGLPDFRVADILRDGTILDEARDAAFRLAGEMERDPGAPAYEAVRRELFRRWRGRLEIAETP